MNSKVFPVDIQVLHNADLVSYHSSCFTLLISLHSSHTCSLTVPLSHKLVLLQEGPFQGPKLGSCLTLRNELSEETHMLTKQEILLGKDTQVESRRVKEPRRKALPLAVSGVLW